MQTAWTTESDISFRSMLCPHFGLNIFYFITHWKWIEQGNNATTLFPHFTHILHSYAVVCGSSQSDRSFIGWFWGNVAIAYLSLLFGKWNTSIIVIKLRSHYPKIKWWMTDQIGSSQRPLHRSVPTLIHALAALAWHFSIWPGRLSDLLSMFHPLGHMFSWEG